MRSHLTSVKQNARGFSVTDLLLLNYGVLRTGARVSMQVGAVRVPLTRGACLVVQNIVRSTNGQPGHPTSPDGLINRTGDSTSVASVTADIDNQFGGQFRPDELGRPFFQLQSQGDHKRGEARGG